MTREEAIKVLEYALECVDEETPKGANEVEAIPMAIEALQTDIVRCGECEHYRRVDEDHVVVPYCGTFLAETELTDFCSYGERKE